MPEWRQERKGLPVPGAHVWKVGETLAMASPRCTQCRGLGVRPSWGKQQRVCECVYRRVFRACLREYEFIRERSVCYQAEFMRREDKAGRTSAGFHRPKEDFACDFELMARRALSPREQRLFRMHFQRRLEWQQCAPVLGMDRGTFYHAVYRIERILGWVYSEVKPYPLFPPADYYQMQNRMEGPGERNPWPWDA